MLFFNLFVDFFVGNRSGRDETFSSFFASSDRNLLEQITYITLVSLYPGDIPNYRGMTVGTAITSSFEDSRGNFMARTSNLAILFTPARDEILVFSSGASCYNHYKQPEESWYVRKHFNRSFHATFHGNNITEREKLVKSFTAFRDTENLGRFSVFRRFFAGNSSVKSKTQWPIALLFSSIALWLEL